jgi:uncharacterized protein HemY
MNEIKQAEAKLEKNDFHGALAHVTICQTYCPYSNQLRMLKATALLHLKQWQEVTNLTKYSICRLSI